MQESWNNQLEEKPVRLTDYLRVLYGGKWIIIFSFIIVVAATAYFTFTTPPVYEAESSVIISQKGGIENTLFGVTPFGKQMTEINNQVEILKSRSLAGKVVDDLFNSPEKDSLKLFYVEKAKGPVNYRVLGVARIRRNLSISPVRDTDIIKIKMKAPSGWEAAFLTNKIAHGYQVLDRNQSRGEISEVVNFLDKQLSQKSKDLKNSEEALRQFQQNTGIVALPEETQRMVDQVVEFQTAYNTADIELKTYQTRLNYLKSQLGDRRESLENDLSQIATPYIRQLRERIAEKEARYIEYKIEGVNENFPNMKKMKKDINALKKELKGEVGKILRSKIPVDDPLQPYQELVTKIIEAETEIEANSSRVEKLKEIVDQYSKKLDTLPDKSMELARLERARQLNENIYLMMKEKYEESRITRAGQIGKIKIVDVAVPPRTPISPKKKMNLILGVLIGLGLGVGITFFLEYLDNSIRTVEDLERIKLPFLGSIPEIKPDDSNGFWKPAIFTVKKSKGRRRSEQGEIADRLITHLKPKSPISEAYRSLRTQIQYSKADNPPRTILVSSPGPGEGKSTSVTNLAISVAQMGSKTILVDADLRRPVLHNLFSLKRETGLSNYLVGRASLDEIIKTTGVENLDLITTGILPPNPSEVLASQRMEQLIQDLSQNYDYVFFDSPPLIAVTDALVLAPKVDGVILVLRSEITDQDAAIRAHELLENVKASLLGSLLNDVSSGYMYGSYYYYYYYYYYYGAEDGRKKKKRKSKSRHKKHSHSVHQI
ncbi:MAG TPA: polysaccharide biosynthesis tyrosine autokinase [Bacteroidetes bacterium]|nr:polysaccharide biosynthesis tyrosine autokinase [Bacteroidota bacterium]